MDLSVIENDPKEVKRYLQNFVPINYYRVLGDEYLHQVRATLLHSVSLAEMYNPVYSELINDLTVTSGNNYATINTKLEVIVDDFSALARKTETIAVEAANANASIVEIQEASASQNEAQASINQRLEASLDDIVVGGRNIMKNSDFSKGYRAWQEASITEHDHYIGKMFKVTSTGIVGSLMGIWPLEEYQNMSMIEGTQYSISFFAFGSVPLMDEMYLTSPTEAPIKLPSVVLSADLTDRRHITFTAPTGGGGLGIIFGATSTSLDDWFSISRVKVELGNKPTDWTPAPEDIDGYIAEVQSSIDTFKQVQVERNNATATSMELLDSRVKGNAASILTEKTTNADRYRSTSELLVQLKSSTENNKSSITDMDRTFSDKFTANASRMSEIEASNEISSGKITNLEQVSTNLAGTVVEQGTNLSARIDGIAVGGRNLLRNADFKLGVDTWGTATITNAKNILGNLLTVTNTGTTDNYFGLMPVDIFNTIPIIAGKEYVLSFHAKGNIELLNGIWIKGTGELPQKLEDVLLTDTLNDRIEIVFIADFTTETGSILISAEGYPKNSWFSVVAVQIEEGNIATAWSLSPEDGGVAVNEVSANIEEFKRVQALENEATAESFLRLDAATAGNAASIEQTNIAVATNTGSIASFNTKLEVEYIPKVEHIEANINNAVKQTDVEYYLSTSNTAPVGGSWLTTAPPWTPSKYMFQRIKTTYVDGLIKHTPSINGTNITGAKGDKGVDGTSGTSGRGVVSIVEQYAVSTSKKTAPTSWGTTMPEWSYGLYVWTRSAITYTDSATPKYTQPLVDSSWEAVNNLEVGGRNLLKDSGVINTNTSYLLTRYPITDTLKEGEIVTVTIWGELGEGRADFWVYNSTSSSGRSLTKVKEGKYQATFEWYVLGNNDSLIVYHRPRDAVTPSVVNFIKLERGSKGTDWTPAPEDVSEAIQGSIDIGNAITTEFGKLKAETKVLTEIGGKISGWKNYNNGTTSSFEILADKFSVGTATTMVKPFSISGSDIVFNGKVSFNSMTGSVSSSQIPNGTIKLDHMVTADKNKINTASTTAASALSNAATAQNKANQAATAASTADGKAVSAQSTADGIKTNIYYPNTTTINGGVIRTNTITALQIAANTITATQMTTDSITSREIKANAVTATQIAANTITATQMTTDSITARELKAGTVSATHIVGKTITGDKIASKTITAASGVIGDLAVDTLQIADFAVSVPLASHIPGPKSFSTVQGSIAKFSPPSLVPGVAQPAHRIAVLSKLSFNDLNSNTIINLSLRVGSLSIASQPSGSWMAGQLYLLKKVNNSTGPAEVVKTWSTSGGYGIAKLFYITDFPWSSPEDGYSFSGLDSVENNSSKVEYAVAFVMLENATNSNFSISVSDLQFTIMAMKK